jgi:hypothetical protein
VASLVDCRPHQVLRIEGLAGDLERTSVQLAGDEDLLHDLRESVRLLGDHVEQLRTCLAVEEVVALPQRQRGTVEGGERRPQLVRDRRDELGPHRFELVLARDVPERVDRPVGERDARNRKPQLTPVDVEWKRLRPRDIRLVAGP